MRDVGILVFLPDFFDLDRAMFIFKASPNDPALVVEPGSLRAIHRPTVVVDAAKLVAELKRGDHLPPTWLLDFSDALKLLNGVAKNDGGAKRNDAWRFVAAHARAASSSTVVSQVRELFNASVDWPESADGPVEQLTLFAEEVSSAWSAVCDARFGVGAVLLPVHDAVLMQLDVCGYETSVRDAAELMRQAMATRCPTVQGRVVVAETF